MGGGLVRATSTTQRRRQNPTGLEEGERRIPARRLRQHPYNVGAYFPAKALRNDIAATQLWLPVWYGMARRVRCAT